MTRSRTEERQGFKQSVRIALMEGDMDRNEAEVKALRGYLVALLFSVTGAAITFAMNLLAG